MEIKRLMSVRSQTVAVSDGQHTRQFFDLFVRYITAPGAQPQELCLRMTLDEKAKLQGFLAESPADPLPIAGPGSAIAN